MPPKATNEFKEVERIVIKSQLSDNGYTISYGRSYEDWVRERAKRIHEYLKMAYDKGGIVELKDLVRYVYFGKLGGSYGLDWGPVLGFLSDFRPSAFIKNLVEHVILGLCELDYLKERFIIEGHGLTRVAEKFEDLEPMIRDLERELIESGIVEPKIRLRRDIRILRVPEIGVIERLIYKAT